MQQLRGRSIIPDTSKAKSQEVFCGTRLIDVAIQEVGVTPNLNVEYFSQDLRAGLEVDSSRLGFKIGCEPVDVSKPKRTNRISCKGKKGGESITKVFNVREDSSPSIGKFK